MVSDKLFHVEGWFNLPDKFPGGCGEALVLMRAYLQEQKRHGDEIKNEESDGDLFSTLLANVDKRAVVSYSFSKLDKETNEYADVDSFEQMGGMTYK